MKYLKLFEDHNEWYVEIEDFNYNDEDGKFLLISNELKKKIEDYLSIELDLTKHQIYNYSILLYYQSLLHTFHIIALKDDWFIVVWYNSHNNSIKSFKCDELEGLKKFFDDKLI